MYCENSLPAQDRLLYVNTVIEEIIAAQYPNLFLQLNKVNDIVNDISREVNVKILKTILDRLNQALDELYRKEKLIFFPFLINRIENPTNTEFNPYPLKSFRAYAHEISSIQNHFKQQLLMHIGDNEGCKEFAEISRLIHVFESDFLLLQHTKEQKLYTQFYTQRD